MNCEICKERERDQILYGTSLCGECRMDIEERVAIKMDSHIEELAAYMQALKEMKNE